MSGLFTRPFAIGWKPVVLRGLDNGEVIAAFEAVVPSISPLPKAIVVSIA